jgi:hypothetical protein
LLDLGLRVQRHAGRMVEELPVNRSDPLCASRLPDPAPLPTARK